MHCSECHYETYLFSNWKRHLLTKKHLERSDRLCGCGSTFSTKGNLVRHQLLCTQETPQAIMIRLAAEQEKRDLAALDQASRVAKEQAERETQRELAALDQAAKLAVEQAERDARQAKEIAALTEKISALQLGNVTNTVTNSNNTTFNLNFFLNETCKDAMTIQEFVQSLPVYFVDDEHKRLWKYIVEQLKGLPEHERPIHCTDLKRQSLAVKYQDRDTKEVGWQTDAVKTQSHIVEMGFAAGAKFADKADELTPEKFQDEDKRQTLWALTNKFGMDDLEDKKGAYRREISKVTAILKD